MILLALFCLVRYEEHAWDQQVDWQRHARFSAVMQDGVQLFCAGQKAVLFHGGRDLHGVEELVVMVEAKREAF